METKISQLPQEIGERLSPMEIWIVDDQESELFSAFLQRAGFTNIRVFYDGLEAFEEMKQRISQSTPLPALIITDKDMTRMNGNTLIENLSKLFAEHRISLRPSIIFQSSFEKLLPYEPEQSSAIAQWKQQLQAFGVDAVIHKDDMVATVFEILLNRITSEETPLPGKPS